jgi:hypothetical protein
MPTYHKCYDLPVEQLSCIRDSQADPINLFELNFLTIAAAEVDLMLNEKSLVEISYGSILAYWLI